MAVLQVRIQSLEDARNGYPVKEGITPENAKEVGDFAVCIQEKGTVGGQTTLMFLLTDKEGKTTYAQCTASQFEMLMGAYKGAQERFNQ
jgi:hypothetical protein